MEKQTLTFADQEIANRLASRKHFLKDVDQLLDWKRINKLISKVEIRRTSVVNGILICTSFGTLKCTTFHLS
jgi:hypothetical protein